MPTERSDAPLEAPFSRLERALIEQFLRDRGYDPPALANLPEERREALLKEASTAASAKLAEVEARSHFLDEIHNDSGT